MILKYWNIKFDIEWTLSNSAPTSTHPHLSPPTPQLPKIMLHPPPLIQNNASNTLTQPDLPKIISHPPPTTHNYPHSLKIMPN